MIKKIYLKRFKKFPDNNIELNPNGLTILAGANNSGKSTIIHALAVWEFCTTYLENEKKDRALLVDGPNRDGLGINIDDFSPINIPDLSYLWTNLKTGKDESKGDVDGYTLRIGCYWDLPNKPDCYLEIGLALANDKMFIKKTQSNISIQDKIPSIAYLPPFAGILAKEGWLSKAERRRNIGRGLAGSVLRNSLIELFDEHDKLYIEKKKLIQGDSKRFPSSRWDELKNISSWDILNKVLGEIFRQNLHSEKFNPKFNIYIRIKTYKIDENGEKIQNYSPRDIMVEGSGFLQWLSVFAFALDREIDILLLDEPDAHLHCKLQNLLIENLEDIVKSQNKQVLVATHSTEIIKSLHSSKIMKIEGNSTRYLSEESKKIGLLEGLGAEYHPLLNKLQKTKKCFLLKMEAT